MKVLITGGFGYLGGRLAQHLSAQKRNEILLGTRGEIISPAWLSNAKVVKTDWYSKEELEGMCVGIDSIVHLAAMNAQDCTDDFVRALESNGVFTARLLQAAIKQKVKRFVYLSTAHVYSDRLTGVITEQVCPVGTHSYATSHRVGEDVVFAAHKRGGIEGVIIRLSNAFGKPTHKNANCWMLLVNDLCAQAIADQCIKLRTSGKQRRDFITLSDACRAIKHLLEVSVNQLGNGLFNVGGMWSTTVLEMAQCISERIFAVIGDKINVFTGMDKDGLASDTEMLDYRIDKLIATGFSLNRDVNQEIDQLLQFLIQQKMV